MATVEKLLSIAKAQIGIKESPPKSNAVKYNDWYYGRHVEGKDYAWCMTFCQWCYNQVGVPLPAKTASCTTMLNAAKVTKAFVNNRSLRPGDLVLFNFNQQTNVSTHCGILYAIDGIKMKAIEGNTSLANDTNGGEVMMRDRTTSQVVGAFRPAFSWEEEIGMTKQEFLRTLTDKEAYDILEKAKKYASTLAEPSWSTKEGHWSNAMKKKLVSSAPEGLVKKDELIAILGRLDLIK